MKSPVTFTMALWAKVDAGNGDQLAPVETLRRLVPYELCGMGQELPPTFFRTVHRINEANARQREALAR
jgi:hypothetical protein